MPKSTTKKPASSKETGSSATATATSTENALSVEEWVKQGIIALEKGDRASAYSIFRKTTDLHPDKPEGWVWLGGTSSSLDDAEKAFQKASALDPQNEEASLGLRWVTLRRAPKMEGIADAAAAAFIAALSAPPDAEEVAPEGFAEAAGAVGAAAVTPAVPVPAAPATPTVQTMPTSVTCPNCGKENGIDQKFCLDCGQDLRPEIARLVPNRDPLANIQPVKAQGTMPTWMLAVIGVLVAAIVLLSAYWFIFVR